MQPPKHHGKTSRINNVFMAEFFYVVAEKKRRGYNTVFFLGLYITVACLQSSLLSTHHKVLDG